MREELARALQEKERLELELQKARLESRQPDKREWVQLHRDMDEKANQVQHLQRTMQKLTMEKFSLESEVNQLKERVKYLEANLSQINEVYMPRLLDVEKDHQELTKELRSIRQDAELLPSMFLGEAQMKQRMRDEKIRAEADLHTTRQGLNDIKTQLAAAQEHVSRKDRVALRAIAARNELEKELRAKNKHIEELSGRLHAQDAFEALMNGEVQKVQDKLDQLQQHAYEQNNRINELEDQKKVLMKQVKYLGERSQAHFTYKMVKNPR